MKRIASILLCVSSLPLSAATFTVTNTADSGPGSLRQAILDANANPGLDTIAFDVSGAGCDGSGVCTIAPQSSLDAITDGAIVDGYTQPGASPNTLPAGDDAVLKIVLDWTAAQGLGLNFDSNGNTVRGLVVGRGSNGISVDGNGNTIAGNFIGTDASGLAAAQNLSGISLVGNGNTVGGTSPADRNIISGNQGGISVFFADGTLVQGNFIGVDASGSKALPNSSYGMNFQDASATLIGGTTAGAGNVISGNTNGVVFSSGTGMTIQGNRIGTDATGTLPVGNAIGVFVFGDATTIGGTGPGEPNVVAFSREMGVLVRETAVGARIRGNSIHDNSGLGIDLIDDSGFVIPGPTANDAGDADTGGNNVQNFPILQSVSHLAPQGDASTQIVGKFQSTPSTSFDLDFYSNPACSNFPREFVEGEVYLGSLQVTTDGSGVAAIDVTFPVATEDGARISATATDPSGNTSEFSQRIIFSITPVSGPAAGGTAFTALGTDFADPTTLTVGGVAATGVTFTDDHTLNAVTPAFAPGTSQDVVVTTPDGTTGTLIKGWVSDFLDVPAAHGFHSFVVTLVSNGITVGRRRRPLRRRPGHQAPADGRLPAEGEKRALLRPAPLHRNVPRRRLPLHLRRLDRGAGRAGHHHRLRRRQLLPEQPRHAAADGRLSAQDQVRLDLRPAGLHGRLRRRRLPGRRRGRLHRAARRRADHRRLLRRCLPSTAPTTPRPADKWRSSLQRPSRFSDRIDETLACRSSQCG